jgi:hypothetical protein
MESKSHDHFNQKPSVKAYVDQFNVLGIDAYINCDDMSTLLYSVILNKFKVTMTAEEYVYFKEYQERVFNLIENLRELTSATIPLIFNYLDKVKPCLADIIIMLWCMPRADTYLSKRMYNKTYKENIQKYNNKMIKNIDHNVMKNFCIETLTKTNNVPVHCIDYLWFYMNTLSIDFTFYNYVNGNYIGFQMEEDNHNNTDENEMFIQFGFNMEYLLEMGLGQVSYENDPGQKGSFRNFLRIFLTNTIVVEKSLTLPSKHNYQTQASNISKNPSKYFGEILTTIPSEIIGLLEKKI